MSSQMWLGHARGHTQWVPCPSIDSSITRNRYVERMQFENGGGDARRSNQYQMQYDFSFSGLAHEVDGIDAFNKFAQGFWSDELIYVAHPAMFETNMMSAGWASPALNERGWKPVYDSTPTFSDTAGPTDINLVANPSMEASSGSSAMYTNLATNPSMETASGSSVTVRTNVVTNPSFETGTAGWVGSNATIATSTLQSYVGAQSMLVTTSAINGYARTNYTGGSAGTVLTVSSYVYSDTPINVRWAAFHGTTTQGATTAIPAGVWTRVSLTYTVQSTSNNVYLSNLTGASAFYVDAVLYEASSVLGTYFDGATTAAGDFTYAWSGTANASTSLQRGSLVTGVSAVNSAAYQSVSWASTGTKSLRISGTVTSNNSNALVTIPTTAGQTYTVQAKMRLDSALAGTLLSTSRSVLVYESTGTTVLGTSNVAPNSAGTTTLTASFVATDSASLVVIYNGSSSGNGDVWLDDLLVTGGTYTGAYFDGSNPVVDSDFTTAWDGYADASTSTVYADGITGINGMTPVNAVSNRSSQWYMVGTKSYRIIPTTASNETYGYTPSYTSITPGATYTAMGTVRIPQPLIGTLHADALKMRVNVNSGEYYFTTTAAANVAGASQLYVTFTMPVDATTVRLELFNGASSGNGNVWWDVIGLVDSNIATFFDGNTVDNANYDFAWTGTENDSTSNRVTKVVTNNQPQRSVTYSVTNSLSQPSKVFTLVIPPTHTLHFGASGSATGAGGVYLRPIFASDQIQYDTDIEVELLDPNGTTRMNTTLDGATYQAVEIFLQRTDGSASTVTLVSMMAQLYKTTVTPTLPSKHYQGEGSTGMMFMDDAIVESYSYMHPPRKGISTVLGEVEAWR